MPHLSLEELPALELVVSTAANAHEQKSYRGAGGYTRFFHLAAYSDKYSDFSVKYSDHDVIVKECETLRNLGDLAVKKSRCEEVPVVPRVFHYFHGPNTMGYIGYIVMERIRVREVKKEELVVATAKAVRWLHSQEMDVFGSLGGGNIFHAVFQQMQSPEPFTSVFAVQTYLNAAINRVRSRRARAGISIAPVDFSGEALVLTQSDVNPDNFGVALDDGRPVIFDTAMIQSLPTTFAYFTLLCTTAFAQKVASHLFTEDQMVTLKASPMFASLAEARSRLSWGNDNLGVDKDGNVRPTRRGRVWP